MNEKQPAGASPPPSPPWLARWLLARLVGVWGGRDIREGIDELFAERSRVHGARAARWWYRRQVAGFVFRWRQIRRPDRSGGRMDGRGVMETWMRELRLSIRTLLRAPGFAAVAIVTLALGIGANTAIFSVIRGSLLRPLPYDHPEGLVWLSDGHPRLGTGINQSIPNLMDLRDGSRLLRSVAMYRVLAGNLATDTEAERVPVLYTSSEMLGVLGVVPRLGRDLVSGDDDMDAQPVVILTDALWRSHYGADPAVVGRTTTVNARSALIVGVLPPSFSFPGDPQLITALQHVGDESLNRGSRGYFGIGRLADGATLPALRTELQGIFSGLVQEYPGPNEDWFTWADTLRDRVVGRNAKSLFLLGGAVALVLLIACVNVANLLLVRAERRQRELAVRYSLGARRAGLLSHFLAEGLVLSITGGVLGVVAASWGVDLLVALYGGSLPRASEIHVDTTVLLFALSLSLLVGLTVGALPLLRIHPDRLHEVLKDASRGSSGRGSALGRFLVACEVALAVLVVSGAGLLANSVWRLQQVELGVSDAERVMTFSMSLPNPAYPDASAIGNFADELQARLEAIPGVEGVGFVNRLPLLGGDNTHLSVFGDPERSADFVSIRMITSGYFDAVGVPLRAGRWLNETEYREPTTSVVINETLARQLFGSTDPLGQRIENFMERDGAGLVVVGVCGDIVGGRPDSPAPPAFYFPLQTVLEAWEAEGPAPANDQWFISALVKTAGDPHSLSRAVRDAVDSVDPQLPIYQVRTLQEIATERLGVRRFAMSLFGVFAALALLLGAVGIYGVMSYSVAQRSPEMGMRIAMGASRGSVLRLVLAEGTRLTAPGVLIGLAGALASARLLRDLLFEVSTLDPETYVLVAAVLGLVSLGASLLPALRATRTDPLASIRSE